MLGFSAICLLPAIRESEGGIPRDNGGWGSFFLFYSLYLYFMAIDYSLPIKSHFKNSISSISSSPPIIHGIPKEDKDK